jgi:superfamily II DNA/RNA helicase
MLDMGFIDDVEEILGHIFTSSKYYSIAKIFIYVFIDLDRETKPQFIVFSATMPNWVHKTAKKYLSKDFLTVDLIKGNTQKTSATVEVKFSYFLFRNYLFFFCFH